MTLAQQHCQACEGGIPAFTATQVQTHMQQLHADWQVNQDNTRITREFNFRNYYLTIAFVNAIAWMAHSEIHHPDMEVSYNKLVVHYSTHAIAGLSENDFICAAKADALYTEKFRESA
jgi:4a-hydroxytetrahydrobiopterin dehydratase